MGDSEILIFISVFSLIIIAFVIVMVVLVLQYRRRKFIYEHEQKMASEMHKAELLNVKAEAQAVTMNHIGIELHDSIAQKLTLASLHIQKTEYENKHLPISEALVLSNTLINETLDEIRLLSRKLTKHAEEQKDIVQVLQSECDRVKSFKTHEIKFKTDIKGLEIDTQLAHTLLRIVQELIQNSLKHSSCKCISVSIESNNKPLELTVTDDGNGFDYNDSYEFSGIGLKNIQKRANMIGAKTIIKSSRGNGFYFQCILPN